RTPPPPPKPAAAGGGPRPPGRRPRGCRGGAPRPACWRRNLPPPPGRRSARRVRSGHPCRRRDRRPCPARRPRPRGPSAAASVGRAAGRTGGSAGHSAARCGRTSRAQRRLSPRVRAVPSVPVGGYGRECSANAGEGKGGSRPPFYFFHNITFSYLFPGGAGGAAPHFTPASAVPFMLQWKLHGDRESRQEVKFSPPHPPLEYASDVSLREGAPALPLNVNRAVASAEAGEFFL